MSKRKTAEKKPGPRPDGTGRGADPDRAVKLSRSGGDHSCSVLTSSVNCSPVIPARRGGVRAKKTQNLPGGY